MKCVLVNMEGHVIWLRGDPGEWNWGGNNLATFITSKKRGCPILDSPKSGLSEAKYKFLLKQVSDLQVLHPYKQSQHKLQHLYHLDGSNHP